jgi:hypothetical protein
MAGEDTQSSDVSPSQGAGLDVIAQLGERLTNACRLLAEEEQLVKGMQGRSLLRQTLQGTCFPGGSDVRQVAASRRLRENALAELKATEKLLESAAAELRPQQNQRRPSERSERSQKDRRDSDHDLAFIARIDSAPAHTREWLRTQFSQSFAGETEDAPIPHPDMPMVPTKSHQSGKRGLTFTESIVTIAQASKEVSRLLDRAGMFDFDALKFAHADQVKGNCISILGVELERKKDIIDKLKLTGAIQERTPFRQSFLSFLGRVDMLYKPDAIYHSSAHAVDVMSTVSWFMRTSTMESLSTPVDDLMVLVAAAIHDVGHPGVNNLFLQKTMDPIALRYNDRSCLENMHLAITFELMQSDAESNWFGQLQVAGEFKSQQYVRKGLISMVLATDMAKHAEYVKHLGEIKTEGDSAEFGAESKGFLLETVLHASDISNPSKPRASMLAWTKLVNLEFWEQGDTERRLGLDISPLCDRSAGMASLPQGQIGFISFVVLPFFTAIARLIPDCQEAVDGLKASKAFWQDMQERGASFEEIFPLEDTFPNN